MREIRSGLVLVDKPRGMTSHDVVARVRRALGQRRVGHAGTLDPLATGLLPVLAGPATRLARFLHEWPKSYVGVIRLGAESPTGDAEGAPVEVPDVPLPPACVLRKAVAALSGRQLQVPPSFSAKKIGGIRAHRLARRGRPPVLEPVPVTIHALRVVPSSQGRLRFAARVSSGTYLRSLARDLGRLCGTGAYLEQLRRSGIGPMRVRRAVSISALPHADEAGLLLAGLLSPDRIPLPLLTARLSVEGLEEFVAGRRSYATGVPEDASGALRVLAADGSLAGIAERSADGGLQPRVVLAAPGPAAVIPGDPV